MQCLFRFFSMDVTDENNRQGYMKRDRFDY